MLAPVALADGPGYVSQGGSGVLSANGKTRYVAVPAGNATAIERVRVHGGSIVAWTTLTNLALALVGAGLAGWMFFSRF